MLRVGLTGGIGAGKSAVARRLARHGAIIIDSDVLAREVVEPGTPGLAEIVATFGAGVLTTEGRLDRPALAAKVFGDDEARRRLEKIIHPRVRESAARLHAVAAPEAVVVSDIPLLVETGQAPSFHLVVVVEAARDARVRRLVATRGMTEEQAAARIAAQADDARRRAAADVLLINDGTLDELNAQVDGLYRRRLLPYERNVRTGTSAPAPRDLRIADPDPAWPAVAERIMARIRHAVRDHPGVTVSHIGSTAVPGLPAKDVIDLMLAVRTLDEADELAGTLGAAGLPRRPGEWVDNARGLHGQTWPKRLHGSADPGRPVNLHVRVAGSPGWRFALLMRDHLRAVPEARDGYAAAKAEWSLRHKDRYTYGEAKEPWFDEEARAADEWAEATGWQPS
ncbi:dephospho-CoA kinase [Paractinoplanes deccanensis]|uniref:Dephospho-CoA kinase n=1 Tax=Paractinoplanes deccanensis TaxID=113561 RepID=A0ABQ3YH12_9ACTN|nr:dephospho-CoA kinase [Actinoplanes deccanensis]GID79210.1 dephospho-CoA kinase [Actinoplanes deccanensis]